MNKKIPKDSILKQKGFYAALYSCVGILLVIAAVMSFNNYSQTKKLQQKSEQSQVDLSQFEGTSASKDPPVSSYLTPADRAAQESAAKKPEPTPTTPSAPSETAAPSAAKPAENPQSDSIKQSLPTETPKAKATPVPNQNAAPATEKTSVDPPATTNESSLGILTPENEDTDGQAAIIEPIAPPDASVYLDEETWPLTVDDSYLTADPVETKPVFNEFTEGKSMKWPLVGEILMDFSSDHAIYDKTLDQYRTNDSICISSELGAQVRASTEGVIKKITKTVEKGNTVIIDSGNGWQTVYSQLQDGILVKEGDVVKEGQIIGGVASPSIYSVLLGNHLEFAITKDDAPIDPKNILINN